MAVVARREVNSCPRFCRGVSLQCPIDPGLDANDGYRSGSIVRLQVMVVPGLGPESVQLGPLDVKPQPYRPGLQEVAVWVVLPGHDVTYAVCGDGSVVAGGEALDEISLRVQGCHHKRPSFDFVVELFEGAEGGAGLSLSRHTVKAGHQ